MSLLSKGDRQKHHNRKVTKAAYRTIKIYSMFILPSFKNEGFTGNKNTSYSNYQ